MTREEKRTLKRALNIWCGICRRRPRPLLAPPCGAAKRAHCLSCLDELVALFDRAPLVDDVAARRRV